MTKLEGHGGAGLVPRSGSGRSHSEGLDAAGGLPWGRSTKLEIAGEM